VTFTVDAAPGRPIRLAKFIAYHTSATASPEQVCGRVDWTLDRIVAEGLKVAVRSSDVVARLGGDEFAILLPETDAASAEAVIRKVQGTVDDLLKEGRWNVTMSIGLLTCTRSPDSSDVALRKADALMYRAKSEGKNTVRHEVI